MVLLPVCLCAGTTSRHCVRPYPAVTTLSIFDTAKVGYTVADGFSDRRASVLDREKEEAVQAREDQTLTTMGARRGWSTGKHQHERQRPRDRSGVRDELEVLAEQLGKFNEKI